jgi:ubiquitin C-terminal hydrolase
LSPETCDQIALLPSASLEEALENFFSPEELELKLCKRCKVQTKHKKTIKLIEEPEILILTIDR